MSKTPRADQLIEQFGFLPNPVVMVYYSSLCDAERELAALRAAWSECEPQLLSAERSLEECHTDLARLTAALAERGRDGERLDWIASRKSTDLVHFTAAGWAILEATGRDLLHDQNIHDLRAAIDAARDKPEDRA